MLRTNILINRNKTTHIAKAARKSVKGGENHHYNKNFQLKMPFELINDITKRKIEDFKDRLMG